MSIITNFDDAESILKHTFNQQLRVSPEEHPVLLSEPPLNPAQNREKCTQIMFESFNVPALYMASQAVLALYSTGRTTGAVVECGANNCYTVPIYEGHQLPHTIHRLEIGGTDLTYELMKQLTAKGINFTTTAQVSIAKDIKEKLCYVASDINGDLAKLSKEGSSAFAKEYNLPDGACIIVEEERFKVPEILFQPHLINNQSDGLGVSLIRSIQKVDIDFRLPLWENVVLSGGTSLFAGFQDRLQYEMYCNGPDRRMKVIATPKYATWIGGSILASLSTFQKQWISKEEYDEFGPAIVHRKCF